MSEQTTFDALVRHATRFGTEGVLEAGAEQLSVEKLTRLIEKCDQLDRQRAGRFSKPPTRRISARTRAERLLGIEAPEEEPTT